jgi:hypothetical protein
MIRKAWYSAAQSSKVNAMGSNLEVYQEVRKSLNILLLSLQNLENLILSTTLEE